MANLQSPCGGITLDDAYFQIIVQNGKKVISLIAGADGTSYILPTASSSILGGIKVGSDFSIASDGTLSLSSSVPTSEEITDIENEIDSIQTSISSLNSDYTTLNTSVSTNETQALNIIKGDYLSSSNDLTLTKSNSGVVISLADTVLTESDVIDTLASTSSTAPLSANMGTLLNTNYTNLSETLATVTSFVTGNSVQGTTITSAEYTALTTKVATTVYQVVDSSANTIEFYLGSTKLTVS